MTKWETGGPFITIIIEISPVGAYGKTGHLNGEFVTTGKQTAPIFIWCGWNGKCYMTRKKIKEMNNVYDWSRHAEVLRS